MSFFSISRIFSPSFVELVFILNKKRRSTKITLIGIGSAQFLLSSFVMHFCLYSLLRSKELFRVLFWHMICLVLLLITENLILLKTKEPYVNASRNYIPIKFSSFLSIWRIVEMHG